MKKAGLFMRAAVLLAAVSVALAGCKGDEIDETSVTGVRLNKPALELAEGSGETLVATVLPDKAVNKAVTWNSDNDDVATVDENGLVTAVKAGEAVITVTTAEGGKTAECAVKVIAPAVPVTGITLDKLTLELVGGEEVTLVATVEPGTATYKEVTWASDKTTVAIVDANGRVTALSAGKATITATAVGGKKAQCVVTVSAVPGAVTGVRLNKTTLALTEGSAETLVATVQPADATNKEVRWSSTNESVVTVDSNGLVTAVAKGVASIVVTTAEGDKKAQCTVTVTEQLATMIMTTEIGAGTVQIWVGGEGEATIQWDNSSTPEKVTLQPDTDKEFPRTYTGNKVLRTITITGKNITHLSCSGFTLKSIDVSKNTLLEELYCYGTNLTSIDVSANTALKELSLPDNNLTDIDITNNLGLTLFDCSGNELTNLDVSQHTALTTLYCSGTQLTDINVSANTALKSFICSNNSLSNLDVTSNTALELLDCSNSQLSNLDVTSNTALERLDCYDNQLSNLDVTNNTKLKFLYCFQNDLTNLDVTNNTALEILDCSGNNLANLVLTNNLSLKEVWCAGNQLTDLTVNSASLTTLDCPDNQLQNLDLTNNVVLVYLNCPGNQLTDLDLTKSVTLRTLLCNNNQLTSLNPSKNINIEILNCDNNLLTGLNVTTNTALASLSLKNNQFATEGLDATFGTLSGSVAMRTVYIYGNPGTDTCNQTLATDRGWKVVNIA